MKIICLTFGIIIQGFVIKILKKIRRKHET